jgi:DNA-binding NarL/FixJ family response regulator
MTSPIRERLDQLRRFQKCLRRATAASTPGEAEAAEVVARRLMESYKIDPIKLTDKSLYDYTSFADNTLLMKLRQEHAAKHQKKTKPKKKQKRPKQVVKDSDFERIRLLLNDGRSCAEIGRQLNYLSNTVNSVRYRYLTQQHVWIRNTDGKIQWATAGQPGGERHAGSQVG